MEKGQIPARIVLVLSNRREAEGLNRAEELGIPALALPHRGAGGRAAHDEKLLQLLREARVEWVCLAGYMRLLSPNFIRSYRQRILNIHPSLLPSFPGLEAQRQALEHGVRTAGCTVHLVDEGLDSGPIVEQVAVPVEHQDNVETLSARILAAEHAAYPRALARLLCEPWTIRGRCLSVAIE
jgi:phosphoribosylglycinamide formyltransferase-1